VQPDADLPLFAWSPPVDPSPTPERFRRAKDDPRDYAVEWAAWVDANPTIAAELLSMARGHIGVQMRCEVNSLFGGIRLLRRVQMNNSHRAAAADWLIAQDPRLAGLIERRQRKVTK
jgi:hypothetical protein